MRLIDAEALKERKFVGVADWTPTEATSWQRGWNDAIDTIIEAQPTIEAERKMGEWQLKMEDVGMRDIPFEVCSFHCSVCGAGMFGGDYVRKYNYCPNCGARMSEGSENDC